MGSIRKAGAFSAALLLVPVLVSACSIGGPQGNRIDTTGVREATVGTTDNTVPGTVGTTGGPGITSATTPASAPVTLRVEGDRGIRFSGVCSSGGADTVIGGEVPKRFAYDLPEGGKLDCRVQKQGSRKGSLRVILLAGNTTRSVQQTNHRGGTIEVSYPGK